MTTLLAPPPSRRTLTLDSWQKPRHVVIPDGFYPLVWERPRTTEEVQICGQVGRPSTPIHLIATTLDMNSTTTLCGQQRPAGVSVDPPEWGQGMCPDCLQAANKS